MIAARGFPMIRAFFALAILVGAALFVQSQLGAQTTALTYRLDPQASTLSARVSFLGFGSRSARFPSMSGSVRITPGEPDSARINVTIDAQAIEAPDETTLRRLRGEKFFWVEQYPTIRFTGTNLRMTSATQGVVRGELTARGVTRAEVLNVTFDRDPMRAGSEPITLTGTMEINRRNYGMRSYQVIVGNKVKIRINARMVPG